jgi:hypothetical protein
MRKLSLTISLVFAISFMVQASAQEVLELEGTEITGNKESPNVLYIVPWKSVERFDVKAPPIVSIMDQQLAPIERASFKRSVHYHDAIYSNSKPE